MKLKMILLSLMCFFIFGCSPDQVKDYENKQTYQFTAIANGVTKYHEKYEIDGVIVTYALSLLEFEPEGEVFQAYRNKYNKLEGNKHILITKTTKIINDTDQQIQPESISKGDKVTFTVRFIENNYFLEATEIKVKTVR